VIDEIDPYDDPYVPDLPPYPGHAAELRTWADEDLYQTWQNRLDDNMATSGFMAAVGREVTRRHNADRWRVYGVEHGLAEADAVRFAAFVDGWDGKELAAALDAFRQQA